MPPAHPLMEQVLLLAPNEELALVLLAQMAEHDAVIPVI